MATTLSTIVVKKVTGESTVSTATLSIVRMADGGIKFTDVNGNTVIAHSNTELSLLFTKITALV